MVVTRFGGKTCGICSSDRLRKVSCIPCMKRPNRVAQRICPGRLPRQRIQPQRTVRREGAAAIRWQCWSRSRSLGRQPGRTPQLQAAELVDNQRFGGTACFRMRPRIGGPTRTSGGTETIHAIRQKFDPSSCELPNSRYKSERRNMMSRWSYETNSLNSRLSSFRSVHDHR
jgi:hypothetical protein